MCQTITPHAITATGRFLGPTLSAQPTVMSSGQMSAPFAPRVGGTLSADIAVPEHARELQFYSRVLTTGDKPLWRDDLMNNHGTPIIGLGERKPEYEELPLQWMPHIQVKDVAASVARALAHEARELMHGKLAARVLEEALDSRSHYQCIQEALTHPPCLCSLMQNC